MKAETIAIHGGNKKEASSRAVIQSISLSTTFERAEDGSYPEGYMYSRIDNPNRRSLEQVVARLEGGADACAFSSGNAAGGAVFQAIGPGAHVIAADDMYHGLRAQLVQVFAGILEVDFVDLIDPEAVKAAIKPNSKLIWAETPSNPLLKICDIRQLAAIAADNDLILAVDNTFSTPVFQNPLSLGAHLVMHSSTKYLSGHSDVIGGVVACRADNEFWKKIRNVQVLGGAVPAPFDCYMTVRGIKTLPYRMRGHALNARLLADFLTAHPAVDKVYFPGLKLHPGHAIAATQMSDFGGMMSFLVTAGEAASKRVVNDLKLFTQATSLGGVESLVEHRASVEGPDTKTPRNLIRVSVGLEHIDDLIADLREALDKDR